MEIRIHKRADGSLSILLRNKDNGRVKLLAVPAGEKPDPVKVRAAIDEVRPPVMQPQLV